MRGEKIGIFLEGLFDECSILLQKIQGFIWILESEFNLYFEVFSDVHGREVLGLKWYVTLNAMKGIIISFDFAQDDTICSE